MLRFFLVFFSFSIIINPLLSFFFVFFLFFVAIFVSFLFKFCHKYFIFFWDYKFSFFLIKIFFFNVLYSWISKFRSEKNEKNKKISNWYNEIRGQNRVKSWFFVCIRYMYFFFFFISHEYVMIQKFHNQTEIVNRTDN